MEILRKPIVFKTVDAVQLTSFLDSPSGQALIDELNLARPSLELSTNKTGFEEMALQAARVSGWETCVSLIKSLAKYRSRDAGGETYLNEETENSKG